MGADPEGPASLGVGPGDVFFFLGAASGGSGGAGGSSRTISISARTAECLTA